MNCSNCGKKYKLIGIYVLNAEEITEYSFVASQKIQRPVYKKE